MNYFFSAFLALSLCFGLSRIGSADIPVCAYRLGTDELPTASPTDSGVDAAKVQKLRPLMQSMVDKHQAAGIVLLVARKGKIVASEAVGMMDIEAKKPMVMDAIFRIYSMTKPITTTAAMMLYEEGRFQLDDPVSKYLPELKSLQVWSGKGEETIPATREMTIRDLMRHTSGLSYGFFNATPIDKLYVKNKIGDANDTLAEFVIKLGKLPLAYQPGTRFDYSYATDVLGRLIEVVSGKPLDVFMQERLFVPLDMHDTSFFVPNEKLNRFTTCYGPGKEKGTLKVIDAPMTSGHRRKPKFLSGGGGLVSTARDYLRFCQMILNGGELQGTRLLKPETIKEMTTNQLPKEALPMNLAGFPLPGMGFGLGFSVKMDKSAEIGWSGAASTFFWIAPKRELVVIALEQYMPVSLGLEWTLKPAIYGALKE